MRMENRRPGTVRRHDDGVDKWEMVEAPPEARLTGAVVGYTSYFERTTSFTARRELAATEGVLIFNLGDPLEIVGADGRAIVLGAGDGFAGGIADATSISRACGSQAGVHVFLPLESLAAVTGVPAGEIANCVARLEDLLGTAARDVGARLADAASHEARFALLDEFLMRRLYVARPLDHAVLWARRQLARDAAPGVAVLADEIGWSRKHLAHRFRVETGIGPDAYRRLARFERFWNALRACPDDSLAGLAVEAGYHDQPHLARDVRAFSDMTPGELRARLIPGQGGVRDD